jgi:hypothetical protein
MDRERANDFLIKLKDFAKYSKLIVLRGVTVNNFRKLIRFYIKKEVSAILLKYLIQLKKGFLIYGSMEKNMYSHKKFWMQEENYFSSSE